MKIIAVDDERHALSSLKSCIEEVLPDCSLVCFDEPLSALEYAEYNPIDFAFLDLRMPEMNGMELAKRLQAIDPKIGIAFVTGSTRHEIQALGLTENDCVFKPASEKAISNAILRFRKIEK